MQVKDRRPIQTRSNRFAQGTAALLTRADVTPNRISVASVAFAGLGCWGLLQVSVWGFAAAALCIQLRLLCNLFDGMVAMEGGKGTPSGVLYNEFPDRIADSLLLVPLGHLAGMAWLGWLCALLAIATAYVRLMGGALGQAQLFIGPMAKQHRMAAMTGGCLLSCVLPLLGEAQNLTTLWIFIGSTIAIGSIITCLRRTRQIIELLE